MTLLDVMTRYFQGEKTEALVFILPLGLLSLVFGGWLLSEGKAGFARGVAAPFLVLGLVMAVAGGSVGFRTPRQAEHLEVELTERPAQALDVEKARMAAVNRAWPIYLAAWGAFGVVGLALRFGSRSDFAQGAGIALVFFSGLGLLLDGFAERRSRPYTAALAAERAPPNP